MEGLAVLILFFLLLLDSGKSKNEVVVEDGGKDSVPLCVGINIKEPSDNMSDLC